MKIYIYAIAKNEKKFAERLRENLRLIREATQ